MFPEEKQTNEKQRNNQEWTWPSGKVFPEIAVLKTERTDWPSGKMFPEIAVLRSELTDWPSGNVFPEITVLKTERTGKPSCSCKVFPGIAVN